MLRNRLPESESSAPRSPELSPERRLAAAIVRLAWEDTFTGPGKRGVLRGPEALKRQKQAIQWILHDSDFDYWCEMSAMNVRAVRTRFALELARHQITS